MKYVCVFAFGTVLQVQETNDFLASLEHLMQLTSNSFACPKKSVTQHKKIRYVYIDVYEL